MLLHQTSTGSLFITKLQKKNLFNTIFKHCLDNHQSTHNETANFQQHTHKHHVTEPDGRWVYEPYTYIVRTSVPVAWSTFTEIKSAATEWTHPPSLTRLITLTSATATTLWNHPTLGDTMATHPTTEACQRTQEAVPYSCVILHTANLCWTVNKGCGWDRGGWVLLKVSAPRLV